MTSFLHSSNNKIYGPLPSQKVGLNPSAVKRQLTIADTYLFIQNALMNITPIPIFELVRENVDNFPHTNIYIYIYRCSNVMTQCMCI